MQKEEILATIVSLPVKIASDFSEPDSLFILGGRIRPLPVELEDYVHNTGRIVNAFADCFITVAEPQKLKEIEESIINSFMYVFDKSTELLYLLEYGDTSNFTVQIAFQGVFYEGENLPYDVQTFLTSLVGKVIICVKSTLQKVENMDTSGFTVKELIIAVLTGAVYLALENYLRIETIQ